METRRSPWGYGGCPYVEQPQTMRPFTAINDLQDWQQSVSLPQSNLGPDPQSQRRVESGLLGVSLCGNTLFP